MSNEEAQQLIHKYRAGECTEKERALLESWYTQLGKVHLVNIDETELELILSEIWAKLPVNDENYSREIISINKNKTGRPVSKTWLYYAAAAVLLFGMVGLGRWLITEQPVDKLALNNNMILPGGNKAILILTDNSRIELSAKQPGIISTQGNAVIRKTGEGVIAYKVANATEKETGKGTNSIETPEGGQYQVILPDGTKIWLNSDSKITYPQSFAGLKERRIRLTGEAYFEVRHIAGKPFFVETSYQVAEDIGTEFNINSYKDEPATKTTLIKGSVRILARQDTSVKKSAVKSRILRPGQQASVQSGQLKVKPGNPEQVLDWKNQEFVFDHQTIEEIMRKIARWYNVKVVYKKNVDLTQTFGGQVSRATPILQVLKGLEATGNVKFEIKGRVITVSDPLKK